ncbi:MAG: integrase arm-type DNA-binding domain-containing protein [Pseudomonadota bacterium]
MIDLGAACIARALTAKTVENLKPDPSRRSEIPDPALTGLYLVVQPSGAKSWAVRYRHEGKPRKLTLGRFPAMTVAGARAAAAEALDKIDHGDDPAGAKQRDKAAKKEGRDSVRVLVEKFDKRHLASLKSGAQAKQFLDRFVVAAWGERDIQTITKRDVLDMLDEIVDSGRATTANRVRAHLSKFLNWCVERDVIDVSPMMGVKAPAKEASRDRVLSDDEIRWFWEACEGVGEPWGPLGRFLLLTGQRLNEAAQMTDDEVSGDLWHLSAERTKNKRVHDVPLSDAANAVLAAKERVKSRTGYVFTTTGETPVQGFHKGRNNIAKHMAEVAEEERGEPVEIPHWTFHDLRRTAATGMARLGIPVRVTEAVLNHVSGTGGGIVAVYQRHDYADEKRKALEAWARFVGDIVGGKADNVVQLEAGK